MPFIADRPLGYVQIASVDTAQGLPLPLPQGANLVLIVVEGGAARWRDDGIDPTAAVGQPLPAGSELRYTATGLSALRIIGQTAGVKANCAIYARA